MRTNTLFLLMVLVLLAGCTTTDTPVPESTDSCSGSPSHSEHAHDDSMTHPADCAATANPSPYVPLLDTATRGLTDAEIEVLRTGAGGGMAIAAELNGYPGPKHIIELKDQLNLNHSQSASVHDLYDRVRTDAIQAGERVLAAHERLQAAFENRTVTREQLESLSAELSDAYADLRVVHLAAHLEAKVLLTPHQNALYGDLRGYGAADHSQHAH